MATVSEESFVASFSSLLHWLRSFGVGPLDSASDLSSGDVLKSCLVSLCPEVNKLQKEPWAVITAQLEGYCGCSLDKALSVEKAKNGDKEELAKVVVLMLCFCVENKSVNQFVIGKIMELPLDIQQDLMALIESGLGKVNSDLIVSGSFSSGVRVTEDVKSLESMGAVTPNRPPRPLRNIYHHGLNTPAGRKWLASPAISAKKRAIPKSPLIASIMSTGASIKTENEVDNNSEQLLILQHQLSVLERKLEAEKKLTSDLNTELQSHIQEGTSLKNSNKELQQKLNAKESRLRDLQDELAFEEAKVKKEECRVAKYKQELDCMTELQEKVRDLEPKASELVNVKAQLQLTTEKLHSLELAFVDKESEHKRLTITHENAMLELQQIIQSKESYISEISAENEEMAQQVESAMKMKAELESSVQAQSEEISRLSKDLQASNDTIKSLSTENKQLEFQKETATEQYESYKHEATTRLQNLHTTNAELEDQLSKSLKEHQLLLSAAEERANTQCQLAAKLQAQLDEKSVKSGTEVMALQQQVADLQDKLDQASAESSQAGSEVKSLREELASLQIKFDEALDEHARGVSELKKKNTDIKAQADTTQSEYDASCEKMKTLEQENSELQATLAATQAEYELYKQEVTDKTGHMLQANVDIQTTLDLYRKEVNEKTSDLESTISKLRSELRESVEEQERFKSEAAAHVKALNETTQASIEMKGAFEEASTSVQSLKITNSKLQAQLQDQSTLQVKLDAVLQDYEQYKAETDDEAHTLRHEVLKQEARIQASIEEHTLLKQTTTEEIYELQRANSKLQSELELLETEYKKYRFDANRQAEDIENTRAEAEETLELTRQEFVEYRSDAERQINILKKANTQLEFDNLYLGRELKEKNAIESSSSWERPPSTRPPSGYSLRSSSSAITRPSTSTSRSSSPQSTDDPDRVDELKRRNKMNLPHLKSSYPVEMQVKPNSPSVSNDVIKTGGARRPLGTALAVNLDRRESSFPRKRARENDSMISSPPSSVRRVSAPPTPDSRTTRSRVGNPTDTELRRATITSMNLRSYLNENTSVPNAGTSFDVVFSPPKAKKAMPKRLQKNINQAKAKKVEQASETRSKTVTKSKQSRRK